MDRDGTKLDEPIIVPRFSWLVLGLVGTLAAAADLLVTRTMAVFFFIPGIWLGIGHYFFPNSQPHADWFRKRGEEEQKQSEAGSGVMGAMTVLYILGLFTGIIQFLVRYFS